MLGGPARSILHRCFRLGSARNEYVKRVAFPKTFLAVES